MSDKTRILVVGSVREDFLATLVGPGRATEIIASPDLPDALQRMAHEAFDAVYLATDPTRELAQRVHLFDGQEVLDSLPDGILVIDAHLRILWANQRIGQWSGREDLLGRQVHEVLGGPESAQPNLCPFQTALVTGLASTATVRSADNRDFLLHIAPLAGPDRATTRLVVTVRDVTQQIQQQQKLAAIHHAGMQLAGLRPADVLTMSVEERIALVKANILHYTKDLLHFDVVEVRLLDSKTGRLVPLIAEGMTPEAASRVLFAEPEGNGVTGFVAATGKSYLCEDTREDPLYLPGAPNARSSLTVPLVLNDEVLGTFNVESPEPRAFTESDLQFLEIFSREVAMALNTLELLAAEKASTAAASVEAIHGAVALPVDEILNDAVNVMERYIGHEPEVVECLHRILRHARDIKQVIQSVGQKMAPSVACPTPPEPARPALVGRRILLVDEDASVRSAAHALLERYGCAVETAPTGTQAMCMVRATLNEGGYDAILADIRLPDMPGYQFMQKLQEVLDVEPLPLILMTGFGYDPGHSIVKARQAGLKAVLYKPFRLDQLLNTVEQVITARPAVPQPSAS